MVWRGVTDIMRYIHENHDKLVCLFLTCFVDVPISSETRRVRLSGQSSITLAARNPDLHSSCDRTESSPVSCYLAGDSVRGFTSSEYEVTCITSFRVLEKEGIASCCSFPLGSVNLQGQKQGRREIRRPLSAFATHVI